jgi:hypothetical protein
MPELTRRRYRGPEDVISAHGRGGTVFDFDKRELVILAVALLVAVVLGILSAFGIAGYLAADNPNDPLTKAGGLSPAQQRAVDTK